MSAAKELVFKIDAYTPETIPMERLAEYMADLAVLLGETHSVHFRRLETGSIALFHVVDREAVPKVEDRLSRVRRGDAPREALDAYTSINRRLSDDNAAAVLAEFEGAEIIEFPGSKGTETIFGPFYQHGTLDGIVIRVGGTRERVPVHIQTRDGYQTHCETSREIARELGKNLFGTELRFTGVGRWMRDQFGNWILQRFAISGFEALDGKSLPEVVADLNAISGSGWRDLKDPWAELARLRDDDQGG